MQLLPVFTLFVIIALFVDAQYRCTHDENLERIRHLEAKQGYCISNRIGTRNVLAEWSPIRVQFVSSYILHDIENRTCYDIGQVDITLILIM